MPNRSHTLLRARRALVAVALGCLAPGLIAARGRAQAPVDHVAMGDRERAALRPQEALGHFEAAIDADSSNYEALWKASREYVDLGEGERDEARRNDLFARAERLARKAVAVRPADPEGHFHLARVLGRRALALGPRDRIKYAKEVRAHALEALKYDSLHPGALHVMGVWNAEVMRLNGFTRMIAKNFLGGQVFGSANWGNARRYMEKSVAVEPDRIVHHLDLAKIYDETGDHAKAREQYELVISLPAAEYNDARYKREAERALRNHG
jgi:tetratricopeptide (TPR) repeat protein